MQILYFFGKVPFMMLSLLVKSQIMMHIYFKSRLVKCYNFMQIYFYKEMLVKCYIIVMQIY